MITMMMIIIIIIIIIITWESIKLFSFKTEFRNNTRGIIVRISKDSSMFSMNAKVTGLLLPIESLLASNFHSLCYCQTITIIARMMMMMMIGGSQPIASDKVKRATAG